jgi:protein-S-isoprenylcysteine O-methyltransferase Ste14
MDNNVTPGVALVAIGVLGVVLAQVLDLGTSPRLLFSATGAVFTIVGVLLLIRARR